MHKIQIWAQLGDDVYREYRGEAERQGVSVESLVEQAVNSLLREKEREAREGSDHPIITS